tara:strand:+ start:914 stop:2509 length:1596 start_codon:yes stop_codon:yes gene_type:complete
MTSNIQESETRIKSVINNYDDRDGYRLWDRIYQTIRAKNKVTEKEAKERGYESLYAAAEEYQLARWLRQETCPVLPTLSEDEWSKIVNRQLPDKSNEYHNTRKALEDPVTNVLSDLHKVIELANDNNSVYTTSQVNHLINTIELELSNVKLALKAGLVRQQDQSQFSLEPKQVVSKTSQSFKYIPGRLFTYGSKDQSDPNILQQIIDLAHSIGIEYQNPMEIDNDSLRHILEIDQKSSSSWFVHGEGFHIHETVKENPYNFQCGNGHTWEWGIKQIETYLERFNDTDSPCLKCSLSVDTTFCFRCRLEHLGSKPHKCEDIETDHDSDGTITDQWKHDLTGWVWEFFRVNTSDIPDFLRYQSRIIDHLGDWGFYTTGIVLMNDDAAPMDEDEYEEEGRLEAWRPYCVIAVSGEIHNMQSLPETLNEITRELSIKDLDPMNIFNNPFTSVREGTESEKFSKLIEDPSYNIFSREGQLFVRNKGEQGVRHVNSTPISISDNEDPRNTPMRRLQGIDKRRRKQTLDELLTPEDQD